MKELDIEVGKIYPASELVTKIINYQSNQAPIKIGHGLVETIKMIGKIKTINEVHTYHIGIKELELLKNLKIKVLSIINPCEQNFASTIINLESTKEFFNLIEKEPEKCFLFDMDELINAGYERKGAGGAVKCLNCVFVKKLMPFKASVHHKKSNTFESKPFVKIEYNLIKIQKVEEKECVLK